MHDCKRLFSYFQTLLTFLFITDPCIARPCKNGGICHAKQEGTQDGNQYECLCTRNFKGKHCTGNANNKQIDTSLFLLTTIYMRYLFVSRKIKTILEEFEII